jgi:hypothetical protein
MRTIRHRCCKVNKAKHQDLEEEIRKGRVVLILHIGQVIVTKKIRRRISPMKRPVLGELRY